jgi:biofilm PGA synthesis N-glycosyltransferase PgaC
VKPLFWLSMSLILFTYVGYPICIYLWSRFRPRPVLRSSIFPEVTILMAVRNEEKFVRRKLDNLAALDYPADRLEIIVISDGSIDRTNEILNEWKNCRGRAVVLEDHCGKATALNSGMAEARGEVVCFTDARQTIPPNSLKNLVANFADSSVGCASGELILREGTDAGSSEGTSLYWRMEKEIRKCEGLAGSTVGATGAFYAVRRDLLVPLPEGTILDDVYIPLQVARQGKRVIFDSTAIVSDDYAPTPRQEFRRKVRTLAGNYQLLQLAPWVLSRSNPLRLQMICHKLLRLLVPFALVGAFVSTFLLHETVYELALVLQTIFYVLAGSTIFGVKIGFLSRLSKVFLTFLVLNTAALVAFVYFVTGRKVSWAR